MTDGRGNQLNNSDPTLKPKYYGTQAFLNTLQFTADSKLGHRLSDNQDFIGEKDFISLAQQLGEIKLSDKKVILNIGDSSTSGWDNNAFIDNVQRLKKDLPIKLTFFQYKTYSDILRNQIGDKFIIINAGVPAYSSLQGSKRLAILIKFFKQQRVKISYVTTYFGNNDSTWWNGGEDNSWIGKTEPRIIQDDLSPNITTKDGPVITRVMPEDYKLNLINIITLCRKQKITPIFIQPETSIYWRPDALDKNQILRRSEISRLTKRIQELIIESVQLWETAMKVKQYSKMKQLLLEELREKDYLLSRVKKDHLKALREVAAKYEVPLVAIKLDRTKDDSRYFMDYCHPIVDANKLFAQGIKQVVLEIEQGKRKISTILPKAPHPVSDNPKPKLARSDDSPEFQYPLY